MVFARQRKNQEGTMKKTYRIGVIPGDGTGPEVVAEGLKVLQAVSQHAGFQYDLHTYDFGGERYLRTGEILPDSASSSSGRTPRASTPGREAS
jgi:3-isopropylmalate dehydrogenase